MSSQARARLRELFQTRAVSFGQFTLASGKQSTYYINSKKAIFHSEAVWLLGEVLWEMTRDLNIAAAGGLEAVASVLAIRDNIIPPTINYETPDPECDLDYVPNKARPAQIDVVLSNSFGMGGQNATLILRRWPSAS